LTTMQRCNSGDWSSFPETANGFLISRTSGWQEWRDCTDQPSTIA
jgi:hypothetical protein